MPKQSFGIGELLATGRTKHGYNIIAALACKRRYYIVV